LNESKRNKMKAKLIKTGNDYLLRDMSGEVLSITNGTIEGRKLSKQNCDEIFGVVDVEKLAKEKYPNDGYADTTLMQKGFIKGFNKAVSLNKDKVFTLEDIKKAYSQGELDALKIGSYSEKENEYIQSLQQPTEMEIEIEMQCLDPNCDGVNKKGVCIPGNKPKLDENGCLILKKVMS